MKKTIRKNPRQVTLDGMMTIGKGNDNLYLADFACCEDVVTENFIGRFKVQGMHNGDVYMQQLPKRTRNKPLFKLDNSSFSLGRNGLYYFNFRLAESELRELPVMLMKEAREAAELIWKTYFNGSKR